MQCTCDRRDLGIGGEAHKKIDAAVRKGGFEVVSRAFELGTIQPCCINHLSYTMSCLLASYMQQVLVTLLLETRHQPTAGPTMVLCTTVLLESFLHRLGACSDSLLPCRQNSFACIEWEIPQVLGYVSTCVH